MKILLIVAIIATGAYLCFRLLVYLGRPLYLQNAFKEIDEQYTKLLRLAEKDLESAIERYDSCKSENSPPLSAEAEQLEQIDGAKRARDHEREVNDKFLRLRIRYPGDFKKLSESVAAYRAYLRLRLYKEDFASAAGAGTVASMSPEEKLAHHQEQYEEARRLVIALEESEKRLDALLGQTPLRPGTSK